MKEVRVYQDQEWDVERNLVQNFRVGDLIGLTFDENLWMPVGEITESGQTGQLWTLKWKILFGHGSLGHGSPGKIIEWEGYPNADDTRWRRGTYIIQEMLP
jgi:hypothetical protein